MHKIIDVYRGLAGQNGPTQMSINELAREDDPQELLHEMRAAGGSRVRDQPDFDFEAHQKDWGSLLTAWEQQNLQKYEQVWKDKYGTCAGADPNAASSLMTVRRTSSPITPVFASLFSSVGHRLAREC